MDIKLIIPFINAALKVLVTMANVKPRPGKPYASKGGSGEGDVSGVLGLTGNGSKMKGSLTISFTEEAILYIASNMLGEKRTIIDDAVCDAVGEIANVISGQARRELSEKGLDIKASIPTVIAVKGHTIRHAKTPSIIIPFDLDKGKFILDVCIEGE